MPEVDYLFLAKEMGEAIGAEKIVMDVFERMAYSRDWSVRPASDACLPDMVVRPTTTEDVAKIVKIANKYKVPVVPCGGLTGMAGGAVATYGGILVDTKGMNKVLEIDEDNLIATVQTGITIAKLNEELEKHNLWFPHDPESKLASTVGAAIACRSDTTFGVKYGKIEQSLVSAALVTGRGEIIKVGHGKTLVSSSGYPLHWLLIASEGTLGIITEATLRVFPKPKDRVAEMVAFPRLAGTVQAINQLIQAGLSIESANIMCKNRFQYYTHEYRVKCGREAKVPEWARGVLCITINGDSDVVNFMRDYALRICKDLGGVSIEEREIVDAWWTHKHTLAFEPFKQSWPDSQRTTRFGAADISIPQGRLDEAFEKYHELAKKHELEVLGMNIYIQTPYAVHTSISFAVYVNDKDPAHIQRFYDYVRDMAVFAVSVGGSMTSYQGDGEKFGGFCQHEHGEAFQYMRMIKENFDPNGIMNPGKKFGAPRFIRNWEGFV
ncbi:MAG: glycolate oxidase subunit GlcD [Candidatus Bathyarchaeota archaeon BA1]|nr:MAG: glycolate oxidase subunit GlcD [Candidatus Bathyarchaeota archaeon BA1]